MKLRTLMLVLIATLACGPTVPTANQAATNDFLRTELQTKAGLLYNFAQFTTWPTNVLSGTTNTFRIGVLGNSALLPVLREAMAGKQLRGHPVEIHQCEQRRQARGCHLLYIGHSEIGRLAEDLRELGNAPVLTVGEMPGFAEQGGMVAMIRTNNRIAFSINLAAARQGGLELSSKLLRLAVKVTPAAAPVGPP